MRKTLFVITLCLILSTLAFGQTSLVIQKGHSDIIEALSFSADGKVLISVSSEIKKWDISNGLEIFSKGITGIRPKFFDHGQKLSTITKDSLYFYDVSTGNVESRYKVTDGFTNSTQDISQNGELVVLSNGSSRIIVYDTKQRKVITDKQYSEPFSYTTLTADGTRMAVSDYNGNIEILSIPGLRSDKKITNIKHSASFLMFSPDGKKLTAITSPATFKYILYGWDIETAKEVFKKEGAAISALFSTDMQTLFVGGSGQTLQALSLPSGDIKYIASNVGAYRIALSPDEKFVAVAAQNGKPRLFSADKGIEIPVFKDITMPLKHVAVSPDGDRIYSSGSSGLIYVWQVSKGRLIDTWKGHQKYVDRMILSPKGDYLVTHGSDQTTRIWETAQGKQVADLPRRISSNNILSISPDGTKFIIPDPEIGYEVLNIRSLPEGKLIAKIDGRSSYALRKFTEAVFSPDGKSVFAGYAKEYNNYALLQYDIAGTQKKVIAENLKEILKIDFIEQGVKVLVKESLGKIRVFDIATNVNTATFDIADDFSRLMTLNSKKTQIAVSKDGVKIYDTAGSIVKEINSFGANDIVFTPDSKSIAIAHEEGSVKLQSLESKNQVTFLSNPGGTEWLAYTHDGYWDGSNQAGPMVSMLDKGNVYAIDQFAVWRNRPDLILQQLGVKNQSLVNHYNKQYKKRLRKLNLNEAAQTGYSKVPTASIVNVAQVNNEATIEFKLSSDVSPLKYYNLFVNDVPVHGGFGKAITGNSATLTEKISLLQGENKIEVSCTNTNGNESFRPIVTINHDKPTQGDLYLVSIGVSKYKNPAFNLKYADKDATDLAEILGKLEGNGFNKVHKKVMVNQEVTPQSIKLVKDFFKDAKAEDVLIVFIAGHGLHDKDAESTYYYLTHNADLNNLKGTAASFETIESIFQGIPPRRKLFFMDTCESGEADDDSDKSLLAQAFGRGIKSRGFKAVKSANPATPVNKPLPRNIMFERDRYIYNDVLRRTGAMVFSSSRGGEYSFESDAIMNGFFTKSLIEAFTTSNADVDKDGIVNLHELRTFVSNDVSVKTGGLQNPVVDRDNLFLKQDFPIISTDGKAIKRLPKFEVVRRIPYKMAKLGYLETIKVSPDGKFSLVPVSVDREGSGGQGEFTCALIDLATGTTKSTYKYARNSNNSTSSLFFQPNSSNFLVCEGTSCKVINAETLENVASFSLPQIMDCEFTRDGKYFHYTGYSSNTTYLETSSFSRVYSPPGYYSEVNGRIPYSYTEWWFFSPSGKIKTVVNKNNIRVIELEGEKRTFSYTKTGDDFKKALSPDNLKYLIARTYSPSIDIIDLESMEVFKTIDNVQDFLISPDGKTLYVLTTSGEIVLYSVVI